ncbi:hypothetical protein [Rhodoplanes roseus]|uniref:hypothetical protein n=1 Tax=Rhodoplanes roseus TaxID=29409 RepID=UPI0011B3E418|nr:hypothetical protein [Rhodoplanes roseus]
MSDDCKETAATARAMLEGISLVLADVARRGQPRLAYDIASGLGLDFGDLVTVADAEDVPELRRAFGN